MLGLLQTGLLYPGSPHQVIGLAIEIWRSNHMRTVATLVCLLFGVIAIACQESSQEPHSDAINAESLMNRIQLLSSDAFEGRAPGSAGEEKTVEYLIESFRSFGLASGSPDGSFIQQVPLVSLTPTTLNPVVVKKGTVTAELEPKVDIAASTQRVEERVEAEGELVFVGYGTLAPEYEWDDFKGLDVCDKILLVLVNDPPGEDIFGGKAMTYYGRWSYKFEIAAELGAAGAFVIHETEPAGYPWEVIADSGSENFVLATTGDTGDLLAAEGWIHVDATRQVFEMAGLNFDEMKQAATGRSFEPVALGVTMSVALQNSIRKLESANVVAKLQGSLSPDEWIIYAAHWDHMGIDLELAGDNIYNGALDNASGTAGLLEIAQAFGRLDQAPARSLLFLAVTAEEQGLLGSLHYSRNPLYPPKDTVAVINMDGLNLLGPTQDITVVGMGQSALDDLATRLASQQGRILRADPEPEKGYYYRSDHFEFAKVGIPAFYPNAGIEFINQPEGWGIEMREKYVSEDYHKPSDEVKDYWDLSGAVEDLELFYLMGYELATGTEWPKWSEKSEFRATREKQRSP